MSQLPVDHNLLTETDQQQGNRSHIENVDEQTHRKAGTQPHHPQDYQYDRYRPHRLILNGILISHSTGTPQRRQFVRSNLSVYLFHPPRVEIGVEHQFVGLREEIHRAPEHPEML